MQLKDSDDAQDHIAERLSLSYGQMLQPGYIGNMIEQMGKHGASDVTAALAAHIGNIQPGYDDRPIGSKPPSVADLLGQIASLQQQARREENNQKYIESDDAGMTAKSIPGKYRAAWEAEMAKAKARNHHRDRVLLPYLRQACGLNFSENKTDSSAWWAVCKKHRLQDADLSREEAASIFQAAREAIVAPKELQAAG